MILSQSHPDFSPLGNCLQVTLVPVSQEPMHLHPKDQLVNIVEEREIFAICLENHKKVNIFYVQNSKFL
jgi:hypothetical protein